MDNPSDLFSPKTNPRFCRDKGWLAKEHLQIGCCHRPDGVSELQDMKMYPGVSELEEIRIHSLQVTDHGASSGEKYIRCRAIWARSVGTQHSQRPESPGQDVSIFHLHFTSSLPVILFFQMLCERKLLIPL